MRRFWQLLGLVGVTLFFLSAFTSLPNLLSQRLAVAVRIQPADAIVVLGAGIGPSGQLGEDSLRRALEGMLLRRRQLAPLLVFSGPAPYGGASEAEVRAQLACELGISAEGILTEPHAWTTREEATRIGALLQPRHVRRILLVTNPRHMVRARTVFEHAGFEVFPAPADDGSGAARSPGGRLWLTWQVLQEWVARIYYRAAGYL